MGRIRYPQVGQRTGQIACWAAALLLLPGLAPAQPINKPPVVAKVESLQFPAWVERGGVRGSVKAGWALYAGDRISTGDGGRLNLSLVGGAQAQFSANASATFTSVDLSNAVVDGQEPSLFKLESGSFSLTTDSASQGRSTGVEIGEGIVINLLSGQVLGRADAKLDQIGLIDGALEIWGAKMTRGRMNRAETMMVVPRAGKAQPVGPMPADKIAQWLGQTELDADRPSLAANGVWDVSIGSGYNRAQLETVACKMQDRGYPAEMYPVREPGKQVWYRVVVRRFATHKDAAGFIRTAQGFGSKTAWVLLPQS